MGSMICAIGVFDSGTGGFPFWDPLGSHVVPFGDLYLKVQGTS